MPMPIHAQCQSVPILAIVQESCADVPQLSWRSLSPATQSMPTQVVVAVVAVVVVVVVALARKFNYATAVCMYVGR